MKTERSWPSRALSVAASWTALPVLAAFMNAS